MQSFENQGVTFHADLKKNFSKLYESPIWMRLLGSLIALGVAVPLQAQLKEFLGNSYFLLLYPTVFFIAWAFGFVPAILATVSICAWVFWSLLPPEGEFGFINQADTLRLSVFATANVFLAAVISRGRKSELDLKSKQELFSTTLTSIADAVIVTNQAGLVQFLNPVAEALTNLQSSQALGKPLSEVFKIRHGSSGSTRLVASDGTETPIESSTAPIRAPGDPQTLGLILVFRDVSEKHQIRARMAESESRFRAMANEAPVLIWTSTPDQLMDWLNHGWLRFTGKELEEDLGHGWVQRVHSDDIGEVLATYRHASEQRRAFSSEFRLRRHDGQFRWVLNHGVPRLSPEGDFLGFIGSCIDIHDQKAALSQRDEALFEAREALRTRDEFMSVASHELKTPLTSLHLQLQVLARSVQRANAGDLDARYGLLLSPEKLAASIGLCEKQSFRLAGLLEELLDLTRVRLGRLQLSKESVDLLTLTRDAIDRFKADALHRGSVVTLIGEGPVCGWWDCARLEQVVTNLISNAIKYGEGHPIEIHVWLDPTREVAHFQIADQGIGIATDFQDKVFERFERGGISGQRFSGLGLGLYITRQIVEAHGGQIRLRSEVSKGSVFEVEVPLKHGGSTVQLAGTSFNQTASIENDERKHF